MIVEDFIRRLEKRLYRTKLERILNGRQALWQNIFYLQVPQANQSEKQDRQLHVISSETVIWVYHCNILAIYGITSGSSNRLPRNDISTKRFPCRDTKPWPEYSSVILFQKYRSPWNSNKLRLGNLPLVELLCALCQSSATREKVEVRVVYLSRRLHFGATATNSQK